MRPSILQSLQKLSGASGLVLLVLFSATPNASTLFFTWPWVFYGQLLLLVPVFLLGWKLAIDPKDWRNERNTLGAMAIAIGVSVLFSRRRAPSLESALFLWSGLAWCGWVAVKAQATSDNKKARCLARTIGAVLFIPLATGLLYWTQDLRVEAARLGSLRLVFQSTVAFRNLNPFGHWNYTGGFALLTLPWFGSLIWIERGRWRLVWMICSLAGFIMFLSASSRGAMLGLLSILVAMFGVAVFTRKISRKKFCLIAVLGVLLSGGLFITNPRLRAVVIQPSSVFQPNEGDVQRVAMLKGGWLLIQQHPWIGHGPGMTPYIYPSVRTQLVGGVETAFQLHNGPLQLSVDHGLAGLLCAIAVAAVLLLNAFRWLKAPPSVLRTFALASAYSLFGYLVLFVTDYQLNLLTFVAVLGLYAGLVLAAPFERPSFSARSARWTSGAVFAAGAVCLFVLIPAWAARESYWSAWDTDVPAETIARLEHTVKIAPNNPYYLNQLALRRARLAETTSDQATADLLRIQAREELARSLIIDSTQEPVHAALGWLWLDKDPSQAEAHFRAALCLLPDRATLHMGLALSRLAQNDRLGAIRELALECLVDPQFVASPLWAREVFVSLRTDTIDQLFRDYGTVIQNSDTPAWRKPQIAYAAAFMRWWLGGQCPTTTDLKGALPDQVQFFEQVSGRLKLLSSSLPPPWRTLENARRDPVHANAIFHSATGTPSDDAINGALARLEAKPADIAQLLRSPTANGAGIAGRKITRGNYAILSSVLDGPGYEDLAPRLVDVFVEEFAGPLFPLRSAIPGPVILHLMTQSRPK